MYATVAVDIHASDGASIWEIYAEISSWRVVSLKHLGLKLLELNIVRLCNDYGDAGWL